MRKRITTPLIMLIVVGLLAFLIGSTVKGKNRLLLLNWGEYINEDLVREFEEEFNCEVVISYADSNELFYQKVKSGTTVYDLVIPSEYMVEKMYHNDLIQEIDLERLASMGSKYSQDKFLPGLTGIQEQLFEGSEKYMIPYFWGTFCIMYNNKISGLGDLVEEKSWATIFDSTVTPQNIRVGMYNIPRYAYAAALFYALEQQEAGTNYVDINLSPNADDDVNFNIAKDILSKTKFKEWGTDTLKHNIGSQNLDLAFCYTGDFFDVLYSKLDADSDYLDHPEIGVYVPENTIAFIDSFVITKKARHVDLAYDFIDFFLRPDIAYRNASIIGYCTPLIESYEKILYGEDEQWSRIISTYPYNPVKEGESSHVGIPLKDLDARFLTKLTLMVDNIKVGR